MPRYLEPITDAAGINVADAGGNYTATHVEGVLAEIAPQLGGGAFLVATTIAALPDVPTDGQPALLRVGATPFEFVALVYDATYGKWVSQPRDLIVQDGPDISTGTGTSYADFGVANAGIPRGVLVPNMKALWDAGLRPQAMVSSWLNAGTAGQTAFMRAAVSFWTDGDAASAWQANALAGGEVSALGTADKTTRSGWSDLAGTAPTRDHGVPHLQVRIDGGAAGTVRASTLAMRWVAAPA